MLATGKGWVLAMLAPEVGRCAWLRSRRQAAPPLPSAARRSALEGSGRGASRHLTHGLRPGSNKGLGQGSKQVQGNVDTLSGTRRRLGVLNGWGTNGGE